MIRALVLTVALLCGCGLDFAQDDLFAHQQVDTSLLGVYAVDHREVRCDGCKPTPAAPLLFIQRYSFMWSDERLIAGSCHDLEGCKELLVQGPLVAMLHSLHEFWQGSDAQGWSGIKTASASSFESQFTGQCTASATLHRLRVIQWPQIEISSKQSAPFAFPHTEAGCDADAALDEVVGSLTWDRYEVLRATMLQQYRPPI